jgi:hypothetical protein
MYFMEFIFPYWLEKILAKWIEIKMVSSRRKY